MKWSKLSSLTNQFPLSFEPVIPITLQPFIFAICPTWQPTAPAAPVTITVWPGFGSHSSRKPKYAVFLKIMQKLTKCKISKSFQFYPVRPKVPNANEMGRFPRSGTSHDSNIPFGNKRPLPIECVLHPNSPTTYLFTGNLGFLLSIILQYWKKLYKMNHYGLNIPIKQSV